MRVKGTSLKIYSHRRLCAQESTNIDERKSEKRIEQNISLTAHESRQVRMRVKEKKKEIESRYKLISGTRKSTGA